MPRPVPNKDIYQIVVNNCFKIWFEWNFCFWWLKRSTVIITIKHHVASNSWNTINPLIAIVNLNWAFQNDKMINFKMLFVGGSYVAVLSPSPKPSPKRTMTPKVFKLMTDVFSVFHHKHFRVICQMGPGKISIASHQNYLFLTLSVGKLSNCSYSSCKEGKELSEKAQTAFACRHLDIISGTSSCDPEKPILCEMLRFVQYLLIWNRFLHTIFQERFERSLTRGWHEKPNWKDTPVWRWSGGLST